MKFQNRYNHVIETVVICPGVTFGGAEQTFHYLFKMAYVNMEDIKVYEPGSNVIPSLHIDDFGRIMFSVIKQFPDPKIRYILAVQPQHLQYAQFAEAVMKNIGLDYSRVKICSKEEMFAVDSKLMSVST
jgi:adenylate kinase